MDFKQWWDEQEIMCGEGGMDAAESAWNHQQQRIAELEAQKKSVYCEAIALLTQVNGTPMEVVVAHNYLTKVYAEQLTEESE